MSGRPGGDSDDPAESGFPFDGTVIQYAAALASVPGNQLPELLSTVQSHLVAEEATYRRRFECVHRDEERTVYLVPDDHWDAVGDALSLSDRERKAVKRTHERQLTRIGSETGRKAEFETGLDIRSAVVIGRNPDDEA